MHKFVKMGVNVHENECVCVVCVRVDVNVGFNLNVNVNAFVNHTCVAAYLTTDVDKRLWR